MILKSLTPQKIQMFMPDNKEYMQYLYLPVKVPGDMTVYLEPRLRFLQDSIVLLMEQEAIQQGSRNYVRNQYVYVTLKQTFVPKGIDHNRPGWHSDGFGTSDVNYIWFDKWPTRFLIGNIEVRDDDKLSMQDMDTHYCEFPNSVFQPDPFFFYRIDQNHVHATMPAKEDGVRMFIKITFSDHIYCQQGNSVNYELDYTWDMAPRSIERNQPHAK